MLTMITVIDKTTKDDAEGDGLASEQSTSEPNKQANGVAIPTENNEAPRALEFPMPPERLGKPPFAMNATKPPDNSDLMSRLRNFLPQMQSANQELLSTPSLGRDPVQLDTNLKAEDDSDSDSDESEPDSKRKPLIQEFDSMAQAEQDDPVSKKTSDETTEEVATAPTIQLEFTVGNMSSNPLMKLLANDDGDSDDSVSSNGEENDKDPLMSARNHAVTNLLSESKNSIKTDKKNSLVLLDSITGGSSDNGSNQTTKKKSLITEIS